MLAFLVLTAASAIMYKIGRSLHKQHGDDLPGWHLLGYLTIFSALGLASGLLWLFISPGASEQFDIRLCATFLIWLPPLYQLSQFVSAWIGETIAMSIFSPGGGGEDAYAPKIYGRANALAKHGDLMGAKQAYLNYFKENPKDPEPLFQAAAMLETNSRFAEAERMYKAILGPFEKDNDIWAKAQWRLAVLYERHLNRTAETRTLCNQIMRRAPKSEPGKQAIAWLVNEGKTNDGIPPAPPSGT